MPRTAPCPFCSGTSFEERTVEYLYSRGGKYLFVPHLPAFICRKCGERFYHGGALLEVERRFKAVHERAVAPDRYETMPVFDYQPA